MMKDRRKGSAIVEAALMMPWIFFLFFGITDFGFYAYAAICTENAARAAALSQATSSPVSACAAALGEMQGLLNVSGTTCSALPVIVSTTTLTNSTTAPACADCALDTSARSIQASVTYQSIPLIPIAGALTNRLTLTRTAEMKVIQ